ncbi:MAG: hypothetical protein GW941_02090 [Candidatus Pacebacteria bacterium]|nr:hypothetical protein [Candidatus Paceibacterota bacterium]
MAIRRKSTLAERGGKGRVSAQADIKNEWEHSSMVRVQKNHQGGLARTTEWGTRGLDSYGNEETREAALQELESRKNPIPREVVLGFERREGLSPTRVAALVKQNRIIFIGGRLQEVD